MAIKAANPIEPIWYTPKSEKDNDTPTQFRIGGLNETQKLRVNDDLASEKTAQATALALQWGLLDWRNFSGAEGPLKFQGKNFHRIPWKLQVELMAEILDLSELDEDEQKNF
jgi:hypothetical protein